MRNAMDKGGREGTHDHGPPAAGGTRTRRADRSGLALLPAVVKAFVPRAPTGEPSRGPRSGVVGGVHRVHARPWHVPRLTKSYLAEGEGGKESKG